MDMGMMDGDDMDALMMMDDKKGEDMKEDDPQDNQVEEEFDPNSCTGDYEGCCSGPNEGKRFVWTIDDLVKENRNRKQSKEIEIIRRIDGYDYRYGIRAHPNMDTAKSCWSILVPWHGEFLVILIYLAFALYFIIESFLILGRSNIYKLRYNGDFDYIFIATLGIAISLSFTATYLIMYSMSMKWFLFFNMLDFMGKIIMVYFFTFAFICSELVAKEVYYPFLYILVAFLLASLVLIQYKLGRLIAFWGTVALLSCFYLYDFIFAASPKQKEVFYIPMFVELLLVGCGYLFYVFSVPERWCKDSKCCMLYFTGFLIFTCFLINFYFEAQDILYITIKLNSGYYDEYDDNWWKTDNIYHKDD